MSPVDGSPAHLLSGELPVELLATASVPDPSGGRFLGGTEVFEGGEPRASVFSVSADGAATRVACDATLERGSGWPRIATLAPDAVYWVVTYNDWSWQIVKTARP